MAEDEVDNNHFEIDEEDDEQPRVKSILSAKETKPAKGFPKLNVKNLLFKVLNP
ncbi:MAG: hypothetical protein HWD61_13975 [Parachlamydiaceae bacterium]|nr:MAG: hypothetical protein HWD61_13975 [Parachlamydiaceae bacterium]